MEIKRKEMSFTRPDNKMWHRAYCRQSNMLPVCKEFKGNVIILLQCSIVILIKWFKESRKQLTSILHIKGWSRKWKLVLGSQRNSTCILHINAVKTIRWMKQVVFKIYEFYKHLEMFNDWRLRWLGLKHATFCVVYTF